LLIPPARHGRQGKPRKDGKPSASRSDGLRAAMTATLASADGKALYALRRQTIDDGRTRLVVREGPHPPGTADLGRQAWEMMLPKLESLLSG
jgi:hypothetical protein